MAQIVRTIFKLMTNVRAVAKNGQRIRVGVLPVARNVFNTAEGMGKLELLCVELQGHPNVDLVNIEGFGYENNVVWPGDDVTDAVDYFRQEQIELLLIVNVNYGDERAAQQVARAFPNIPVCTYAISDGPPNSDGTREADRTCGHLPLRYLVGQALRMMPDYIPISAVGSPLFQAGLMNELRVAGAVRNFRQTRILQIGPDQSTFPAIETDRIGLDTKYGITVEHVDLSVLMGMICEGERGVFNRLGGDWKRQLFQGIDLGPAIAVNKCLPRRIALTLHSILQLAADRGCNTISLRCWAELMADLGVMPCWVLGALNGLGLVAADETDNHGALSMQLLFGASLNSAPPILLDNTITLEDGRVLWWHCGPAWTGYARGGDSVVMEKGWIIPIPEPGCAGYIDCRIFEIGQPVTFCRFNRDITSDGFAITTFEMPVVDGPETRGTHFYGMPDDPAMFELDCMHAPIVHHNGVVPGEFSHSLLMAASWLGARTYVLNDGAQKFRQRIVCREARPAPYCAG